MDTAIDLVLTAAWLALGALLAYGVFVAWRRVEPLPFFQVLAAWAVGRAGREGGRPGSSLSRSGAASYAAQVYDPEGAAVMAVDRGRPADRPGR